MDQYVLASVLLIYFLVLTHIHPHAVHLHLERVLTLIFIVNNVWQKLWLFLHLASRWQVSIHASWTASDLLIIRTLSLLVFLHIDIILIVLEVLHDDLLFIDERESVYSLLHSDHLLILYNFLSNFLQLFNSLFLLLLGMSFLIIGSLLI